MAPGDHHKVIQSAYKRHTNADSMFTGTGGGGVIWMLIAH